MARHPTRAMKAAERGDEFVRRTDGSPPLYYWHIRLPSISVRTFALYRTPEAAGQACRIYLAKLEGLMHMIDPGRAAPPSTL